MFGMTVPQAAATLAATLVGAKVGLFADQRRQRGRARRAGVDPARVARHARFAGTR